MKFLIFSLSFILFTLRSTQAEVLISGNLGFNDLVTKELSNRNGRAAGSNFTGKIGWLNKDIEIGVYNSNIKSSTNIKHDSTTSEATYLINSVGAYVTYYKDPIYFEIGYGKASIKEKLTSNLTGDSLSALKSLYNLHTDQELSSTEARFLAGIRLVNYSIFTLTFYGQKIKMLETSHDETDIGFELKIKI